jgi:hypothetical protein
MRGMVIKVEKKVENKKYIEAQKAHKPTLTRPITYSR